MSDAKEVAVVATGILILGGTVYAMGKFLPDGHPGPTRALALTALGMALFNWKHQTVFPDAKSNSIVIGRWLAMSAVIKSVVARVQKA
jgi:hypothetical protein